VSLYPSVKGILALRASHHLPGASARRPSVRRAASLIAFRLMHFVGPSYTRVTEGETP